MRNSLKKDLGESVSSGDFQYVRYLKFQFTLDRAQTSFNVRHFPNQTPAEFISSLLGGVSGVFGIFGSLLGVLEGFFLGRITKKSDEEAKAAGRKPMPLGLPFADAEKAEELDWVVSEMLGAAKNRIKNSTSPTATQMTEIKTVPTEAAHSSGPSASATVATTTPSAEVAKASQ